MKEVKVFKFGGSFFTYEIITSFKTFFLKESDNTNNKILLVVSAIKGVTRLLRLIYEAQIDNLNEELKDLIISLAVNEFHKIHIELMNKLLAGESLKKATIDFEKIFINLQKAINSHKKGDNEDKFYARVLKFGELASSSILNSYLNSFGHGSVLFDARDYIETDDNYKDAKMSFLSPSFQELFAQSRVLITQGFIAKNFIGEDTVLGFDGSDLSAVYFSVELKKTEEKVSLTFWKDIDGFYKKDPNVYLNQEVSYKMSLLEYQQLPTRPIRLDSVILALEKGINIGMKCHLNNNGHVAIITK